MIKLSESIIALLDELEDIQTLHGLSDDLLYRVASEESRKETFVRMYQALKEIKNGQA